MKLDYRDILIEELERIQEKKASFSSRAYAKYLGLSPSHLSDVLKKRSGLSKAKAIEISEKLKFPDFRKELFVTSVEAAHSRSKKQREKLSKKVKELQLQRYRFLKEEVLSLLSEWHHFAILEMTKLDDFQLDAKWVSGQLKIPESIVRHSIEKLLSLGLIVQKDGKFLAEKTILKTLDDIPSKVIKSLHHQMLGIAIQKVYSSSLDKREFQSMVLATDKDLIPVAKKRIREFQMEMNQLLTAKAKKRNVLYHLGIQLYPFQDQ